jgi:hypothetical protein
MRPPAAARRVHQCLKLKSFRSGIFLAPSLTNLSQAGLLLYAKCKAGAPQLDPLEKFIDESIRLSLSRGYPPTTFQRMRRDYGTVEAIERLVKSGEIQSGFKKLLHLGLSEWSIEAAVLKFPDRFSKDAIQCAEFRLRAAKEGLI